MRSTMNKVARILLVFALAWLALLGLSGFFENELRGAFFLFSIAWWWLLNLTGAALAACALICLFRASRTDKAAFAAPLLIPIVGNTL